jgi:hypothetical protein
MKRQIAFRCAKCSGIERVPWGGGGRPSLACSACGFVFEPSFEKAKWYDDVKLHRAAGNLAVEHGIDIPSATSVLLGILTLQQARALPDPAQKPPRSARARTLLGMGAVVAIAASLLAPLRKPAASASDVARVPVERAPAFSRSREPSPPAVAPAILPVIAFKLAPSGQLSQVSGPDPSQTFTAFCMHASNARKLSPIGITQAVPPKAGERLGIVRDYADLAVPRAVKIRRDQRTRRWVIGDGASTIVPTPAPNATGLPDWPGEPSS